MQIRTILLGLFAVMFGLCAASGVYLLGQPRETHDGELISVVVAKENIPRGRTISLDLLQTRDWPKELVPADAIRTPAEAAERTVSIPMLKNEPLLESKLAPKGAGRGMAALIPAGMRAFTIHVPNVATGVAGFVLPGNHVDVLLTIGEQGANDRSGGGSTITLLQNVEILAVDQLIDVPNENRIDPKDLRSVTLLVSPASAARLTLGQNRGTLQLSLRNREDFDTASVDQATLRGLRGDPADEPSEPVIMAPVARPSVVPRIRTLRGTQTGYITFPPRMDQTVSPALLTGPQVDRTRVEAIE